MVALNGKPVDQWYDVLEVLRAHAGKPISMEVAGRSGRRTLEVTSRGQSTIEGLDGKPRQVGRVGIAVKLDFRVGAPGSSARRLAEGWNADGRRVHPDRADGPRSVQRPDLAARRSADRS